jgi:hypothetical protein
MNNIQKIVFIIIACFIINYLFKKEDFNNSSISQSSNAPESSNAPQFINPPKLSIAPQIINPPKLSSAPQSSSIAQSSNAPPKNIINTVSLNRENTQFNNNTLFTSLPLSDIDFNDFVMINKNMFNFTPVTYRYYKFVPTKLRKSDVGAIQISELILYNNNIRVDYTNAQIINKYIKDNKEIIVNNNPISEKPQKAIDNNINTKWLDVNQGYIIMDFQKGVTVNSYTFFTGNDMPDRDPISWQLYGSNNYDDFSISNNNFNPSIWTLIDEKKDYPTTQNRNINVNNNLAEEKNTFNFESVTNRYYKFVPTKLRNPNADSIQISELILYNNNIRVDYKNAQVINKYIKNNKEIIVNNNPISEKPEKGIDNNINTKWLDFNKGYIIIDFQKEVTINSYTFFTGNDAPDRDPISWELYGSNNYDDFSKNDVVFNPSIWKLIDEKKDYSTIVNRLTNVNNYLSINNNLFRYGVYRFSCSSIYANNNDDIKRWGPFNAFTNNNKYYHSGAVGWNNFSNDYVHANKTFLRGPYVKGIYRGGGNIETTFKTSVIGVGDISGEWLQVQLPYKLILNNYGFLVRENNPQFISRLPGEWVIVGSNDGFKWEFIDKNSESNGTLQLKYYNIKKKPKAYSFLRLIVPVIGPLKQRNELMSTCLNLTQWVLNGYYRPIEIEITTNKILYDFENMTPYNQYPKINNTLGLYMNKNAKKAVMTTYGSGIYFSEFNDGWGSWTKTLETNNRIYTDVKLTNDGLKGVVSCGYSQDYVYFFTWQNKKNNYSELTQTLDTIKRDYWGVALTSNGDRLIACANDGFVYFSLWNGINYGEFTQTLDITNNLLTSVSCVPDGSIIAYCNNKGSYWAIWNGINYSDGIKIPTTTLNSNEELGSRKICISSDGNFILNSHHVKTKNDKLPTLLYTTFNPTIKNYTEYNPISSKSIPYGLNGWGLYLSDDNKKVFLAAYDSSVYYKFIIPYKLSSNYETKLTNKLNFRQTQSVNLDPNNITNVSKIKNISFKPWAIYNANNWNNDILKDLTGNDRDATTINVTQKISTNKNIKCLSGTQTSSILFPPGSIPSNFTICSLTRYSGPNKNRILQSTSNDWVHGHWNGKNKFVYYDSLKGEGSNDNPDDWSIIIGTNDTNIQAPYNIYSNGNFIGKNNGGTGGEGYQLGINSSGFNQYSDFEFSLLIIWDTILNKDEIEDLYNMINSYLNTGEINFYTPIQIDNTNYVNYHNRLFNTNSSFTIDFDNVVEPNPFITYIYNSSNKNENIIYYSQLNDDPTKIQLNSNKNTPNVNKMIIEPNGKINITSIPINTILTKLSNNLSLEQLKRVPIGNIRSTTNININENTYGLYHNKLFNTTSNININFTDIMESTNFVTYIYNSNPNPISLTYINNINTKYKVGFSSLIFNSVNKQFISLPEYTPQLNGISYSLWFKSSETGTWGRIFEFGNGPGNDNIVMAITNNSLGLSVRNGSTPYEFTDVENINFNNNVWYHVVWLLYPNPLKWEIYVNGNLILTKTDDPKYPSNIKLLQNYLGRSTWPNDPWFNGEIDDFKVYNKILSPNEINNLYNLVDYVPNDPTALFNINPLTISTPKIYKIDSNTHIFNSSNVTSIIINVNGDINMSIIPLLSIIKTKLTNQVNVIEFIKTMKSLTPTYNSLLINQENYFLFHNKLINMNTNFVIDYNNVLETQLFVLFVYNPTVGNIYVKINNVNYNIPKTIIVDKNSTYSKITIDTLNNVFIQTETTDQLSNYIIKNNIIGTEVLGVNEIYLGDYIINSTKTSPTTSSINISTSNRITNNLKPLLSINNNGVMTLEQ